MEVHRFLGPELLTLPTVSMSSVTSVSSVVSSTDEWSNQGVHPTRRSGVCESKAHLSADG
jgi:hypothetical protein